MAERWNHNGPQYRDIWQIGGYNKCTAWLVCAFIRLVTGSPMKLEGYFNLFLRFLNLLDKLELDSLNYQNSHLYIEKNFYFITIIGG